VREGEAVSLHKLAPKPQRSTTFRDTPVGRATLLMDGRVMFTPKMQNPDVYLTAEEAAEVGNAFRGLWVQSRLHVQEISGYNVARATKDAYGVISMQWRGVAHRMKLSRLRRARRCHRCREACLVLWKAADRNGWAEHCDSCMEKLLATPETIREVKA